MSCWVFVLHDVVFEEGQPHHTLASVGEQIPIFDADIVPPADQTVPAINDFYTNQTIPNVNDLQVPVDHDPVDQRVTNQNDHIIPIVLVEPR